MFRKLSTIDAVITQVDLTCRILSGVVAGHRQNPAQKLAGDTLNDEQRQHSAGLMRVNHVGEVCAQALYQAQGLFAKNKELKEQFAVAAQEEQDHLAWTAERIHQLGSHLSVLNPLWYAGAFACGAIAAKVGDAQSLGFVVETERQVEAHLNGHLQQLPDNDVKSRAIVVQMRDDEIAHGAAAQALGAVELPHPIKVTMQGMAKVMTTLAYYV